MDKSMYVIPQEVDIVYVDVNAHEVLTNFEY